MAEQFADLIERSSFSKQIGGQCVAEEMRTFASGVNARADQRPPDDCGDCDGVRETMNGQFGLARETVRKMLRYSVPPGYRRQQPARRPKLDAWVGAIDQILKQDKTESRKQRHTAKRIFERLRNEHAYT